VLIVDAGFDVGPRAIQPGTTPSGPVPARAEVEQGLSRALFRDGATGTVILAAAPGETVYVLDAARSGLLTHGLLEGLSREGGASPAGLMAHLERSVTRLSELEMLDEPERPLVIATDPTRPIFEP
jgi:hypothetical protein